MQKFPFLLLAVALPTLALAQLNGRVVGVTDGDTITLLDSGNRQHKIRLGGIDAPEAHQSFGQKSKASLSALVFGREVTADCSRVDRYRRQVCKVLVNGTDANMEQIRAGMAWWYRKYAKEQSPNDQSSLRASRVLGEGRAYWTMGRHQSGAAVGVEASMT
jgi:endonuclease YncB( thermonuclease family)